MNIYFTKSFKKAYNSSIQSDSYLVKRFDSRYDLFENDPSDPILKDHTLSGKLQGFRASSITGDVRVVYYIHDEVAYFVDIGTHKQVYNHN